VATIYLIDTDVCIKVLKKKSRVVIGLFLAHHQHVAVSDITVFELYTGAEKYDDRARRRAVIQDFLSRIPIFPFDSEAARIAGEIRGQLEIKGQKIGAYDVQIAGVARARHLILATNNLREFNRVPELQVEKWG
jgi:tRNA(fMet)-specific endonuclease VapC